MTREKFKEYICYQIDMMDESELDEFASFITTNSEDEKVIEELIIIKGEFKKLTKLVQSMEQKIDNVEVSKKDEELKPFILFDNFLKNSQDAIDSLPKASMFSTSKVNRSIISLQSGFSSSMSQYENILNTLGLKRCAKVGDRFDASLHEVVEVIEDREIANESVVEVLEEGFIYSDKIINYAKVKVNRWI
ncbi:MAG: nucleotide exchange factor GrpE [Sulfurovum sp.]